METFMKPTIIQFEAFENAYEYFNKRLFDDQLPPVILNLSHKNSAMGFVSPFRWRKAEDEIGKGSIHELSINPEFLSMSFIEVYSTLVHEQCHIWQYTHGKLSRNGYHNQEWANKMKSVGFVPSHTGREGGNMTEQNMSDYPQKDGVFLQALEEMPQTYKLPFVSVEGDYIIQLQALMGSAQNGLTQGIIALPKQTKTKTKHKYTCHCGCNV